MFGASPTRTGTSKQLSTNKPPRRQRSPFILAWAIGLLLVLSQVAQAQVIGRVFRDFNANGIQDTPISATAISVGEPGVPGIVVTAYRTTGAPVSATTTITGSYTFTAAQLPSGTSVRLEFGVLSTSDFSGPFSAVAAGSSTSVQFVTAGAATNTANFGINYPTDFCGSTNPLVYTTCFVQNLVPTNSANDDVLVGVNYNATAPVAHLATSGQVGAVWGVAHDRNTNKIYTSAFIKRHVGLATTGGTVAERTGAIYVTTPDAVSATTALFVSLDALGFDTGTDPHGTLPTSTSAPSYDVQSFTAVGKVGLGGIDLSDDGQFLYTINLFDRKLYRIPTTAPTAANVVSYSITNPCGNAGDFRPFAVKFYRGNVYVGVICSSESNQARATLGQPANTTQITATVYQLTGTTFTPVLSFPLSNFLRGQVGADAGTTSVNSNRWYPWLPDTDQTRWLAGTNNQYTLPQPILSDIEFDVNGDMIIGLMDRFGHQTGYLNYFPDPAQTNTTLIRTWANGDQLRARRCGAATTFTLESNASLCGGAATSGAGNGQGPGGGEWYPDDDALSGFHKETSNGGMAQFPGSGELIVTTIDPTNTAFSGGIRWYTNNTGAFARGFQLYSQTTPGTFGKAAGIGDAELRCAPAPIEIGNRVWKDDNRNGIQDPAEAGIQGVDVKLYKGNVLIATATTNVDGEYYFSAGPGTNTVSAIYNLTALSAGSAVELRIDQNQPELANLPISLTNQGSNDGIDNDFALSGVGSNTVVTAVTLGLNGQNVHTFDAGFASCPPLAVTLVASSNAVCIGQPVTLTTSVTPASSFTVTGPIGVSLTGATTATAIATNLTTGVNTFTVTASSSPTCFTTATVSVTVSATPLITLTASQSAICLGQSVTLNVLGIPTGGLVTFGTQGPLGTILNPTASGVFSPTATTTFLASVAVPGIGGLLGSILNSCPVTVTVNQPPVIAPISLSLCAGATVNLTSLTGLSGLTNVFRNGNLLGLGTILGTPTSVSVGLGVNLFNVTSTSPTGCTAATPISITGIAGPALTPISLSLCVGATVDLTSLTGLSGLTNVFRNGNLLGLGSLK